MRTRCGRKLIWIPSREDETHQDLPLLGAVVGRSETLARGLSVQLLGRWERERVWRAGFNGVKVQTLSASDLSAFRLHVPVCPLSSCNLRDGYSLHLSAQVSDVIGYRLTTTHPIHPAHLFKTTHSHWAPESVQFSLGWLQGKHTGSQCGFFLSSLSLKGLLLPKRNAAYLKQSHDFTGSQNDPRGLLSGEREREGGGEERERYCRIVWVENEQNVSLRRDSGSSSLDSHLGMNEKVPHRWSADLWLMIQFQQKLRSCWSWTRFCTLAEWFWPRGSAEMAFSGRRTGTPLLLHLLCFFVLSRVSLYPLSPRPTINLVRARLRSS